MTDKKGQKFNAYVRPNHEKVKYDFSRKRPEQSQIYEVKPDAASRTQVAVNSEGKTDEATKHIGEPRPTRSSSAGSRTRTNPE